MAESAVIYARYSSDSQSEESITAQLRACNEYAKRQGYTVINEYVDRAMSARSANRPQFLAMIDDARTKTFQFVIVHKLDRFSRDRYDHAIYRKELQKHSVRVLSVLENLDDSPESRILEGMLEGISEYFSANLARETRKGLKEAALQHRFTGGVPPYGYDTDHNNRYIINPSEAAVVRRIYDACINGYGYTRLAQDLNREGYKTKFRKPFTATSFNAILKNVKYAGTYTYTPDTSKPHIKMTTDDIIPAIIDKQTFREVQRIMNARKNGKAKAIEPYLLSGIMYCECGAQFHGHRRPRPGGAEYNYECAAKCGNPQISRDIIETAVINYIQSLLTPESLAGLRQIIAERLPQLNAGTNAQKQELSKEIDKITRQLDNTIDLLIDDATAPQHLKDKVNQLAARLDQKKAEYDALADQTYELPKIERYAEMLTTLSTMTRSQKQIYVTKIIKKVTVLSDGHFSAETTFGGMLGGVTPLAIIPPFYCCARLPFRS